MRRGFVVTACGAALATWLSVGVASAAPVGTLSIAACIGAGVTVTATTIDWLPAGGGNGCINTVTPTNISYTGGGPLVSGTNGLIADLGGGLPVPDFMTFAGHPLLSFELTSIGPGVANAVCPNTFDAAGPVCSIFAGSPFVVRPGGGGATVTLAAFGLAHDDSGIPSNWMGSFSVDFAGETPADLQARFLNTGTITSGHSGSFVVTFQPVPEPASLMLLGTGLIGAAMRARKGLRRRER
jgi:hypothetical protein